MRSPSPTRSPTNSRATSPSARTNSRRTASPPRWPVSTISKPRSTRSKRPCCCLRAIPTGNRSRIRWHGLSSMRSAASTAWSSSSTTPSRWTRASSCSPRSKKLKASPSRSAASALHARGCHAACSAHSWERRSVSASLCCSPVPTGGSAPLISSPESSASRSTRRSLPCATTRPTNSPCAPASTVHCRTRTAPCAA